MGVNVERLRQDVAANGSAVDSAIILLDGLKEQLRAALASGNVDQEVGMIADSLEGSSARLAAAVAMNTAAADDSDTVNEHGDPIADGTHDGTLSESTHGSDVGPGTTTGAIFAGDTTTQPGDSGMTTTQPEDPSQGASDGNVPTNDPGSTLNPRTSESDPVVGTDPNA